MTMSNVTILVDMVPSIQTGMKYTREAHAFASGETLVLTAEHGPLEAA